MSDEGRSVRRATSPWTPEFERSVLKCCTDDPTGNTRATWFGPTTVTDSKKPDDDHPRVFIKGHKNTRNLKIDYDDICEVLQDLPVSAGGRGGAKATLIFPSSEGFVRYYLSLGKNERHLYSRCIVDQPFPMAFDLDKIPVGEKFDTEQELVNSFVGSLSDFLAQSQCVDIDSVGPDSFAVFTSLPYKKIGDRDHFSLHLHSADFVFKSPHEYTCFVKDFVEYLGGPDNDFGVDAGIAAKGSSLRLPLSSKAQPADCTTAPRILVRYDREDITPEDHAESVMAAWMAGTCHDSQVEIQTTYAPANPGRQRSKNGVRVLDANDRYAVVEGLLDDRVIKDEENAIRVKLFPGVAAPESRFRLLHANAHRRVWQCFDPIHCNRCDRVHESNTNFMTKVDHSSTPPQIVLMCFQSRAHASQCEHSRVLGPKYGDAYNYTFSEEAAGAIIAKAKTELELIARYEDEKKDLQAEVKAANTAANRANQAHIQSRWEEKAQEAEDRISEIDTDLEAPLAQVALVEVEAIEYVERFFVRLTCGSQGGQIMQLRYCHDPAATGEDDCIVDTYVVDSVTNFCRGYIGTTFKALTLYIGTDAKVAAARNIFTLWIERGSSYTGAQYMPWGSPAIARNPDHFNLFRGFPFSYLPGFLDEAADGAEWEDIPELFFPAIMRVIRDRTEFGCDGGTNMQTQYFLYWLHCLIKCPGQPVPIFHIFSGDQGIGKSLIASLIRKLVGDANTVELTTIEQLFSHFNAHVMGKLFFIISELTETTEYGKNRDQISESRLKDWLGAEAGSKKSITKKGKDTESAEIYMWPLGSANARLCAEMDRNERRKNPIDASRVITPQPVFGDFVDEMESRHTLKILFHWLYEMQPIGMPPENLYFRDPGKLPQTPYVASLKQVQETGGQGSPTHMLLMQIFFDPIFQIQPNNDPQNDNEGIELFVGGALAQGDDDYSADSVSVLSENNLVGNDGIDYLRDPPAGSNGCRYLRIPSSMMWRGLSTAQQHSNRGDQNIKKLLFEITARTISPQYRDWYKAQGVSKGYKINNRKVTCFTMPYGEGGAEMLKICKAIL